jgi:hypothetical protein
MLPTALSAGDLSLLDPQQRQLLRQLSNSTQHSGQSQPNGDLGTSTSGGTGSPDGAGQPGTAGGFNTSPANSSQTPAAEEEQAADSGKYALPVAHLKVSCGDMVGVLLVHKARIRIYEGTEREKEVSPTEFERLGGRSATKKWKQSIRLIGEDGEQHSSFLLAGSCCTLGRRVPACRCPPQRFFQPRYCTQLLAVLCALLSVLLS